MPGSPPPCSVSARSCRRRARSSSAAPRRPRSGRSSAGSAAARLCERHRAVPATAAPGAAVLAPPRRSVRDRIAREPPRAARPGAAQDRLRFGARLASAPRVRARSPAIGVSPPLFVLSRLYRPRMRRQSRQVKKLESSALAVVQETLGALRVVKAFGQESRETDRFVHRSTEGVAARIRMALMEGRYGMLVGLTSVLGTAAVLFIGVRHLVAGVLTVGQLWMALRYLDKLYEPLKTISKKAAGIQSYLASAERAFALLDEQPEVPERPDARPLERARGALEFRGVSFAYGPDRPVLHDVSCVIPPGTRLGIVGATGAGKTTLISLLTRFYDPQHGAILLDGTDLREYRLTDLRRQFAVVLQDPVLFSVSIAENIAYAAPGASREQIVAAAQAANVHEFIARLPQGYDTQVGERGDRKSTRLNSSHEWISYAVFCLKKKT